MIGDQAANNNTGYHESSTDKIFWADTNTDIFDFSLLINDVFALLKLQLNSITVHFFLQAT